MINLREYFKNNPLDMTGFKVKNTVVVIGPANYLNAFFSTIQSVSKKGFFTKETPVLLTDLSQGKIKIKDANRALQEVSYLRNKFKKMPLKKVLWDLNTPYPEGNWPACVNHNANSAYEFFTHVKGGRIIDALDYQLNHSNELKWDLVIHQMFRRPDEQIQPDQTMKKKQSNKVQNDLDDLLNDFHGVYDE